MQRLFYMAVILAALLLLPGCNSTSFDVTSVGDDLGSRGGDFGAGGKVGSFGGGYSDGLDESPVPNEPVIQPSESPMSESPAPSVGEPDVSPIPDTAPNHYWFEDAMREYLIEERGFSSESYMVSPASFRAALCLVIEGADGETKQSLLNAAGFLNEKDMQNWYAELLSRQKDFLHWKESVRSWSGEEPDMGFDLANGLWDNESKPGGFKEAYIKVVADKYFATVASSPASVITSDVNQWCSEKTHGMIQKIAEDLSDIDAVLANALYIKSLWRETFSEYMTSQDVFTKLDGSTEQVTFMKQTEKFLYYKDTKGDEYASFALEGDIWLTVCLSSNARVQDLLHAMYNSVYERLEVKMPKLDMETTLDKGELTSYLEYNRANLALSDEADFSVMTDSSDGWHIDDIIQKTRIKTDEDGLEAAAVTAVMMVGNAAVVEPAEPIPFYMDKPFSFMITAGRHCQEESAVVLFFGQFVGD